ncbi:transglutaminase domain-containing protein [Bacillus aquiflavi]|uniref:Transglutaminase domain-containing protein n=1 Tax=Bacillus aquiflavi TaxID=2672567 RepID=A0A6B3W3S4_9BACI|nr:transglutaminase-like domain-containing protein [Bacillus aquiflavi]MBA4537888.1 transglutaminase domain-containing protein [Bacillus aquiflavi]NEY82144.1 transglutaminase domain-containing protein [Bacillus aquiflavi]UAC48414.1 transglutaminase-like domain-containing protein [Bacillus aquiflavi]
MRSTTLSPVDDEIKSLASKITKDGKNNLEKAKLLFDYIVEQFVYHYPPKKRGAKSFLQEKRGDCGEYSSLFSSCCRAIGIPCRTLIGTWATGKLSAHVWNEAFIEGKGWIPVDCSMAHVQKKKKWQFLFSNIKTVPWEKYFGQTENQRIVFSFDADLPLNPEYPHIRGEEIPKQIDSVYIIQDRPFYWGYQTLNGNAPYMQPVYVRFDNENLAEPVTKPKATSYLGVWKVKESGMRSLLLSMKYGAFILLLLTFLAELFTEHSSLPVVKASLFVMIGLSFLLRRERVLLFSVLTFLFTLSLLSSIFS